MSQSTAMEEATVSKKAISKTLIAQRHRAVLDACELYARATSTIGNVSALNYSHAGSNGGARNSARPTVQDYLLDLDQVFAEIIDQSQLLKFKLVYCRPLFDDDLKLEIYAQKVFGGAQHGILQRAGRVIIDRGLRSTDYFHVVRNKSAGLPIQIVFEPRAKEPVLVTTAQVNKRYAELRNRQLTTDAVPEPVAEIQESSDQSEYDIEPQELEIDLFNSETRTPQEGLGLLDSIELAEQEMSDPFQQTGLDYHEIESCG
jgi:hypothetical protein